MVGNNTLRCFYKDSDTQLPHEPMPVWNVITKLELSLVLSRIKIDHYAYIWEVKESCPI